MHKKLGILCHFAAEIDLKHTFYLMMSYFFSQSTPDGHTSFVKESIIYSKTAINRCEVFRANMMENTSKCLKDLRKQAAAVEIALTDQIIRMIETIRGLETALQHVIGFSLKSGYPQRNNVLRCYSKFRQKMHLFPFATELFGLITYF